MKEHSEFEWTCPACGHAQTEWVTEDGPVMALICGNCTVEFDHRSLSPEIRDAWEQALEEIGI